MENKVTSIEGLNDDGFKSAKESTNAKDDDVVEDLKSANGSVGVSISQQLTVENAETDMEGLGVCSIKDVDGVIEKDRSSDKADDDVLEEFESAHDDEKNKSVEDGDLTFSLGLDKNEPLPAIVEGLEDVVIPTVEKNGNSDDEKNSDTTAEPPSTTIDPSNVNKDRSGKTILPPHPPGSDNEQNSDTIAEPPSTIIDPSTVHEYRYDNVGLGKTILPSPPPGCSLILPIGTRIKYSTITADIIDTKYAKKTQLNNQRGISQCSVLLSPSLYMYELGTVEEKMRNFNDIYGPFAMGKVIQVPNHRKNIDCYVIEYDAEHSNVDGWITHFPKNDFVVDCLKVAVERANRLNWRKSAKKKKTKSNTKEKKERRRTTRGQEITNTDTGTTALAAIIEDGEGVSINFTSAHSSHSNYRPPNDNNENPFTIGPSAADTASDASSSSSSSSDDDEEDDDDATNANCDLVDSAFASPPIEDLDDNGLDYVDNQVDDQIEFNFFGKDWQWNHWEDIEIDDIIHGPPEDDHYNGPHGLKTGIAKKFNTVLQCLFQTTAMDSHFFSRLVTQSNKMARRRMAARNSTLFLGHKWTNITVGEMIRFFGVLLRISLEPRKMAGYESYFVESKTVHLGQGYGLVLRGYNAWAKDIMTLVRFKQIRSAFRPEADVYDKFDKCNQLRYFIRRFNAKARGVFHLGPNVSFDEGGVAMRSRYCPVRQYNKDKPDKYRVDFFILADAKHYFIYHLDVYQGKNKANIDIHPSVRNLPTTQKAVANAIIKSGISNDSDGSRHIFMDNRYAAPQLLALMMTNYNVRAVGTCKANRIGFDSDKIVIDDKADRGTYRRLVDKRLGMVITRWKDSKILQTVSTVMIKGCQTIQRRNGAKILDVVCPNDIVMYQKHMGGVDRGDQHRLTGAGFANVAHFKKWYKKAFLGIADFSLLQAFTAWNLSVDEIYGNRRGNTNVKRKKLVKWEFYSAIAEELMTYCDRSEMDDETIVAGPSKTYMEGHNPNPYFTFKKESIIKRPVCMVCSMEETVKNKVFSETCVQVKARKHSRRVKFLGKCTNPGCDIVAHTCNPRESKVSNLSPFQDLTCFEIAHTRNCDGLFRKIKRKGKEYYRTITTHDIAIQMEELYRNEFPRRSKRKDVGRPPKAITLGMPNNEIDSLTCTSDLQSPYSKTNILPSTSNKRTSPRNKRSPTDNNNNREEPRKTRKLTLAATAKSKSKAILRRNPRRRILRTALV